MPHEQPDIAAEGEDEEGGGIDFDRVKQIAGFFIRAPRRRPKIAIVTLVVGVAIVVFLAKFLPRTYTVDMRFLAQRNLMLPALGNPGRSIPQEAGNLTRGVADTIMRRDNMLELARDVDLLNRWKASRPGVLRFKDSLLAAVGGVTSDEDQLRGLIATLEQRLVVTADDTSVTITLDWSDKQVAFDLVSTLGKNFVEARYDSEIAVINEAIGILEQRSKEAGADVDSALAEVVKIEADRRAQFAPPTLAPALTPTVAPVGDAPAPAPPRAAPPPRPVVAPVAATPPVGNDASDDVAQLADVRRRLAAIDADQKKKVSDAQAQIDEARLTLGPMHPTVVALQQKLDQLKAPSAEMTALRAEEREILERLSTYSRSDPATPAGALAPARLPAAGGGGGGGAAPRTSSARLAANAPLLPPILAADDSELSVARSKLATATSRYDELLRRIESAQIELDVARASYKYQYIIVRPPELPTKARKPNVPALVIGGILVTFLLALGLSGLADLMSGRILEPWQVEHRLKLPVLGELLPPKS